MERRLTEEDLSLDAQDLYSLLKENDFPEDLKLYQGQYYPAFFLPFSITVIWSKAISELAFTAMWSDEIEIDLTLEQLHSPVPLEALERRWKQARAEHPHFSLWEERSSLSPHIAQIVGRRMAEIRPHELADFFLPQTDGISLRGKVIDMNTECNEFNSGWPTREIGARYYAFFVELLNLAESHLKTQRSLLCLRELQRFF